jgi:plastocyanin
VKDILVAILDDGFFPSVLRISRGTKVTWVNKDINSHWPVSDLPGFGSDKELKTGESYSFTFENTGVFKYHDKLNLALTAVVEVVE